MGKKTEIVALPTKMLAVELGSKKRWKRVAVIGVVLGLVIAGAVTVVVRTADQKEAAALETSWTDLGNCLVGAPLKDGETVGGRVGLVQLAVLGTPKEKRGKPNEAPWPASCAPYAFALSEHANAAEAGGPALAEAAQALGQSLKNDATAMVDQRPAVEKVWAAATAAKLKGGAASAGGTLAPAPAAPLFDAAAFAALPKLLTGNFTLANVFADAATADGKVYLLVDQKEAADGPALCTATGAEAQMLCMKVPAAAAKLSPGLRLVGTTDPKARPFYFAGDHGSLGIFPPDGKDKVGAAVTVGATARADGSLLALTRAEGAKDVKLLVAPATGAATERAGIAAADLETPPIAGLFWDWLVYKSPGKAGAPGHLFARKIPDGPGELAAAVDVGAFDEPPLGDKEKDAVLLSACRTDDATAVRVRGGRADGVAIFAGGRWSAPVKTATHGGALTCRGVEATVTEVRTVMESDKNFAVVTQSRCSASGCNTSAVNLRELFGALAEIAPSDAHAVAAADVAGKLLLVWSSGVTGGLRMRLAPPDAIKATADVILADGRAPGAAADKSMSAIVEVRAIATGSSALVLVATTSGVKALRVDDAGKVTPLRASL